MEASAPAIGAILMIIAEAKKFLEGELLFFDALRAKSHLANLFLKCQMAQEDGDEAISFFRENLLQAMEAEPVCCEYVKGHFPGEFESFSGRCRFFYLIWIRWLSLSIEIDSGNYPRDDMQTGMFFRELLGAMENMLAARLQQAQGF